MDGALSRKLDKLWTTTTAVRTRAALADFAALLFPTECVGCGLPDASLCADCSAAFRSETVRPFRAEGAAEALPERYPLRPDPRAGDESEPLPVVSAGIYSGRVAQVVLAFKNHGHTDLAPQLLAALAGALHHAARTLPGSDPPVRAAPMTGTADVLLVPVPGKGSSFRGRGYDPLGLLLHRLARRKLLPEATAVGVILTYTHRAALLHMHSLPTGKTSSGQKGLGRRKRRISVRGSMRVRRSAERSVAGRSCIIIDDVLTTGATIAEAARALHLAGATVVGAVVVAATSGPRRDEQRSALPPPAN